MHVLHDDADPYVGKVFDSVLAVLRAARARDLSAFGLSLRDAVSPGTSTVALARALAAAAFALRVPAPRIFLRPDLPGGLAHLPSNPIATLAGGSVLQGFGLHEL